MKFLIGMIGMALLLSTSLFAAGEQEAPEAEEQEMIAPRDQASDDVLLQRGLPAIPDDPVTLEFFTIWSGDGFQSMVEFLEQVPGKYYPNVTVEAQEGESGELKQVINTRLAGGNPPPLLHASPSYFMSDWAEQGALVDLTDIWDEYDVEEIVSPGVASTMQFNGRYYGVPFAVGQNNILYYNLQLLNEAGVDPPPYDSWDEFFSAAEDFNAHFSDENITFWAGGYSPAWFGFAKTLGLAASRFGPDLYARILNGEATQEDFENVLSFHRRVYEVANEDFVSMNSITGGVEAAGRGDAALAYAGGWGHPRFVNNNLEYGEDWGMSGVPGTPTFLFTLNAFMVFKGSGQEDIAKAIAATAMLKESQLLVNPDKGTVPGRTDVDAANFPKIGRWEVAEYSNNLIADANTVSVPRAVTGLPSIAHSEYPAPASSYMAGSISLEEAASQLVDLQERHQDAFTVDWEF